LYGEKIMRDRLYFRPNIMLMSKSKSIPKPEHRAKEFDKQKTLCDSCAWITGSSNMKTSKPEKPQQCIGRSPIVYCDEYIPRDG